MQVIDVRHPLRSGDTELVNAVIADLLRDAASEIALLPTSVLDLQLYVSYIAGEAAVIITAVAPEHHRATNANN